MQRDDICWRKARLAARIILRSRSKRLTVRDRRVGARLKQDKSVTERLLHQALAQLEAARKYHASS